MLVNAPHPVLTCAATIDAALKDLDGVEPVFMRTSDKADALVEFARLETQLAAWRLRMMAAADDVADETGARDVAAWLAHETHASPKVCRAELHLAAALDARWTRLADAIGTGDVNLDQAIVIARALDELPEDLDPALLVDAEVYLVEAAAHHQDPRRHRTPMSAKPKKPNNSPAKKNAPGRPPASRSYAVATAPPA